MSYRLSLLDKSPVAAGRSAAEALRISLEAARLADTLGYHRYWLAEHHAIPGLASAAPEILISHILAQTKRIRVGSAGILLQHYSAYKVAELFSVLASLAPGRVDLGVGRSPGGLPRVTRALQKELRPEALADLDRRIDDLAAWLRGPHEGAAIIPRPETAPQAFLLGGSAATARKARDLGWGYVHAGHHDGNAEVTRAALSLAREGGAVAPVLAVLAFAAPTRAEAEARLGDQRFLRLTFEDGHSVNLGSKESALDYAAQYGPLDYSLTERRPTILAGTAEDIHAGFDALARDFGIAEFVIDQPVAETSARLASLHLIAGPALSAAA